MPRIKTALSPITVLMIITAMAAVATWFLPAGKYDKMTDKDNLVFVITRDQGIVDLPFNQKTLDSLHILIRLEKFENGSIRKPVSIPGTFHRVAKNKEGPVSVLQAPIRGIYEAVDIILFILLLGAFIDIFQESGALISGLQFLSHRMKGNEKWLIILLTFLFTFAGSSYGMQEEALIFYPVITPIFLAAGFDLVIPVAVIFGGTQLGYFSSFTNPFSTILASNAAGVNWTDGLNERILIFIISTAAYTWYITRYAVKIKLNPSASFLFQAGEIMPAAPAAIPIDTNLAPAFTVRTKCLLILFLATFLTMIAGVIFWDWWFLEMSVLILAATLTFGVIIRMNEQIFIKKFIRGAEGMLSVAFIVGVARGITIVLKDGNISDTILYYVSSSVIHLPHIIFILLILGLFLILSIFISSSSAMAVLTMPILGGLAVIIGIPGREIVNTYLYGMGIMGFIAPSGLILPSLAITHVNYKAWWRFIFPFLIFLLVLSSLFLIVGLKL